MGYDQPTVTSVGRWGGVPRVRREEGRRGPLSGPPPSEGGDSFRWFRLAWSWFAPPFLFSLSLFLRLNKRGPRVRDPCPFHTGEGGRRPSTVQLFISVISTQGSGIGEGSEVETEDKYPETVPGILP